jgi:dimethylglycine dehydrogenase
VADCDVQPIGNAPVFNASGMVGRITSGGYGHTLKQVIALAYINVDAVVDNTNGSGALEAEILGQRYSAQMVADSPYDPENLVQS